MQFFQNSKHSRPQGGFSLIELLVVVSISAVVAGGGFISFVSYSNTQTLRQTVSNIRLAYDQARNFAISNVKPLDGSCHRLVGYEVILGQDASGFYYSQNVVCLSADNSTVTSVGDLRYLPDGIVLSRSGGPLVNCSGVRYAVITGNVTTGTTGRSLPCTFIISHTAGGSGLTNSLTIENDGNVITN